MELLLIAKYSISRASHFCFISYVTSFFMSSPATTRRARFAPSRFIIFRKPSTYLPLWNSAMASFRMDAFGSDDFGCKIINKCGYRICRTYYKYNITIIWHWKVPMTKKNCLLWLLTVSSRWAHCEVTLSSPWAHGDQNGHSQPWLSRDWAVT